jgi:hypothetical protein
VNVPHDGTGDQARVATRLRADAGLRTCAG